MKPPILPEGVERALLTTIAALTFALASPVIPSEWRHVERVIDGDTVVLDGGERVRLIGVDTPETVHPRKPVERYGKEASEFTRTMVEGRRVRLEYGTEREDRYGRTLAYVYMEDGTLLNEVIIKYGYGHAYTRFPFSKMDDFREAERSAREDRVGLWRDEEGRGELEVDDTAQPAEVDQPLPDVEGDRGEGEDDPLADDAPPGDVYEAPVDEPEEKPEPILSGPPLRTTPPQTTPPIPLSSCIPATQCCKICSRGKACGNTCISRGYTCHVGRGCACDLVEVCR